MKLRPSSLPKLAACACYESEPEAGDAAQRGTRLDEVFRSCLARPDPETADWDWNQFAPDLELEDAESVQWAVETAKILAGGSELRSLEDDLRIETCGMDGTADLLCPDGRWSADLKSGEIRNYLEQQAAYALGFMEAQFEEEWTVYLLYCDQREVERLHFTRDEAEKIVRGVVARAKDPQKVPTPCDYCGWCAARFRCQARLEQAMPLVAITESDTPEEAFELVLADNDKLSAFLKAVKVVKDLEAKARDAAMNRLIEGKAKGLKIPGVSLVTKRGSQVFPGKGLVPVTEKLGIEKVLDALGAVSKTKAKNLFDEAELDLPEDQLIETAGSCYVQVR